MKLRQFRKNIDVKGKRVLVRIDANVPIVKGKAVDGPHGRIARSALDINWLSQRGARVIVLAHLGRPKGRRVSAYSLKPIAKRLSSLLGVNVKLSKAIIGAPALKAVSNMKDGDVLMLENLRFDRREHDNDAHFAKSIAELGDLYMNDAFGVCHRAHASSHALTKELPSYAGPLLAHEVSVLSRLDEHIKHPFVLVMGGMKMSTKLPVMTRFADEVESILVGGALATTLLSAQGFEVGKSVYDKEGAVLAKKLPANVKKKLVIPTDVVVASSLRKDAKTAVVPVEDVGKLDRILDIGPETIHAFILRINKARTIVWNGPLGYCEVEKFCVGTHEIARAISYRTGAATTIVGGGDTMPTLERMNIADKFTLLSTGGGAMLEFLATNNLPCLEVLKQ